MAILCLVNTELYERIYNGGNCCERVRHDGKQRYLLKLDLNKESVEHGEHQKKHGKRSIELGVADEERKETHVLK